MGDFSSDRGAGREEPPRNGTLAAIGLQSVDRLRYEWHHDPRDEYWHLRENDPSSAQQEDTGGASRVEIKFSFGNCLDNHNEVKEAPPYGYVPEVVFRNLNWVHHLTQERFPTLAGWQKDIGGVWN